MKKSIYTFTLLLCGFLLSFSFSTILNIRDERKKINELYLKILSNEKSVNIAKYIVKLYIDFGLIKNRKICAEATATIIKVEGGIIHLLTAANCIVKYLNLNCLNCNNHLCKNDSSMHYSKHYAKNISFFYQGKEYRCSNYYIHPDYSIIKKNKDIAIIVSHQGKSLFFPYSFFPKIVSVAENKYKGYIIGYPADRKGQEKQLYGMPGTLERTPYAIKYNRIDTSNGQSGSAIWAEVNGVYQIIGVHTIEREFLNCGPFISQNIIEWKKLCWLKAREIYEQYSNMKKLLNAPTFEVNSKDKDGVTPFLMAIKAGSLYTLKKLKEKGANLHDTDNDGKNALDYAVQYATNPKLIEWLIDTAQLPIDNTASEKKHKLLPPFLAAAKYGNFSALKVLRQKGAKLDVKDENGKNALHYIVQYGTDVELVNWLIDVAQIPINSKGLWFYGETPFLIAAQKGNLTFLKVLKEKGANLHATDKYGYNALHFAIDNNVEYEVIDWLINVAKVDINAKRGYYQKTPFLCAAQKGNLPVLKLLKAKNANLYSTDKEGKNALHLAVIFSQNHTTVAWLISEAYIPIESTARHTRSKDSRITPFLWAAKYGNLPALKVLKNKKANIYAQDKQGKDALWYANQYSSNKEVVSWLQNEYKFK